MNLGLEVERGDLQIKSGNLRLDGGALTVTSAVTPMVTHVIPTDSTWKLGDGAGFNAGSGTVTASLPIGTTNVKGYIELPDGQEGICIGSLSALSSTVAGNLLIGIATPPIGGKPSIKIEYQFVTALTVAQPAFKMEFNYFFVNGPKQAFTICDGCSADN